MRRIKLSQVIERREILVLFQVAYARSVGSPGLRLIRNRQRHLVKQNAPSPAVVRKKGSLTGDYATIGSRSGI